MPDYLNSEVKEVWIIDPEDKSIKIITKTGEKAYLDPKSNEIIESTVLPDLHLKVVWIWKRKKYPSNIIIKTLFS